MKLYRPIKYQARIVYPTLDEVKAFTETYRLEFMDRDNPDKGWHKFNHSREVEVLTIGGINDYFLVYAYPPAGFTLAEPEDILQKELWRGWILERESWGAVYRLDTSTQRDGIIEFKSRKTELGY